jgi:hypothetical protein
LSSVCCFLFQGAKKIVAPWLSKNDICSIQKNNKILGKASSSSGAGADMDSDVHASSSSSEQNAPLDIVSNPAEKGSCNLVKGEDEKKEEGKTENNVIKCNADKTSEIQQSKMS